MKTNEILIALAALIFAFNIIDAQTNFITTYNHPGVLLSQPYSGGPSNQLHNIRVMPSSTIRAEPTIAIDPTNNRNLLIGNIVYTSSRFYVGCYYSTDAGTTWGGNDDLVGGNALTADPTVGFAASGLAYYCYIRVFNEGGPDEYTTVNIKKSTNGGSNWTDSWSTPVTKHPDKPHMVIDGANVYVAWTEFRDLPAIICLLDPLSPSPVKFAYSNNGGTSFTTLSDPISGSTVPQANPDAVGHGVNLSVGPNGYVYAVWSVVTHGCSNEPIHYHESALGFNYSTDHGASWKVAKKLLDISGIKSLDWHAENAQKSHIRVNSFPVMAVDRSGGANNGSIYIVWADQRSGDVDILLIKSTDNGQTWVGQDNKDIAVDGVPIRVNQDVFQNGKDQWFPWITVNPDGIINVVFYDNRSDENNLLTETWVAQSFDGAKSFSDYRASDYNFNPKPIYENPIFGNGDMGDYIGIVSTKQYSYPCWMDNRSVIHNPDGSNQNFYQTFIDAFGSYYNSISIAQNKWNLLSVPSNVHDFAKNILWPNSVSPASYMTASGFATADVLADGQGYWIKFGSNPDPLPYVGGPLDNLAINVFTNWNMIGSLSQSLPSVNITSVPPGIITSSLFSFTPGGGYSPSNSIEPGLGYWLRVSQVGQVILNPGTSGGPPGGCAPPPVSPQGEPQTPVPMLPAYGSTVQTGTATLTWGASEGATKYGVEYASNPGFVGATSFENISGTSQVISGLTQGATYWWHAKSYNLSGGWSGFSCTFYFTIYNPPPPCNDCCVASMSMLDQFAVTDANGNSQKMYAINGGRTLNLGFHDYSMPPEPPKGIFHARFRSGKLVESIPPNLGMRLLPIKLKDMQYPIIFSWKVHSENATQYWVSQSGNGQNRISISDSGSLAISNSGGNGIVVIAQSSQPPPCLNSGTIARQDLNIGMQSNPISYILHQNMPNPFNPTTMINYELPEDSRVTLKVYNILGQEVASLVDGLEDAGYKTAIFNSENMASGVYFYRITAGRYSDIKKMILIR
jgi:hypothetical protein